MAKVTGALFSMDASGGFAGALVFGKWKGRQTVRQLVTPANPRSQGQEDSRNEIRVSGAGQHFANITTMKGAGRPKTDKELLIADAPPGQAWNGNLVNSIIGKGSVNYNAAKNAYSALTAGDKTAWNSAAASVVPAIPAVNQTTAGGAATTPMTNGEVWFHYQYGLYIAGVAAIPTATPPTYA